MLSKNSRNAVNIITGISISGVAVVAMALIIVLSVFNGFEKLINSLYSSFDPDIKITVVKGKTFVPDAVFYETLLEMPEVVAVSKVLEEKALVRYGKQEMIAVIKGVDQTYEKTSQIKTKIVRGAYFSELEGKSFGIAGQGVANELSLGIGDVLSPVHVYVPKPGKKISTDPSKEFSTGQFYISGAFSIQADLDNQYLILPLEKVTSLLRKEGQVSALELALNPEADHFAIQERIKTQLGAAYKVQNRFEQHETLYKIMKTEKWAIFMIFTFILVIATFNIVGSLTMLIIDKKDDLRTLWNMGANIDMIRRIFIYEGILITGIGALIGIVLGSIICLLQEHVGLLELGNGNGAFVVSNYPVAMHWGDLIIVLFIVMFIGALAARFPVRRIRF